MIGKIEHFVIEENHVILCISGRITEQDVDTPRGCVEQGRDAGAIDLKDILLVDRKVVRFLASLESTGTEFRNCPAYIREWITRESASKNELEATYEQGRMCILPWAKRPKSIAIIDEDESTQKSFRELLESAGFATRGFGSAARFLESDLHREVGCLIAEMEMPGMSGLELQARLNAEQCSIPIIFIVSNGGAWMRIQAMRAGAVEFLAQPLDHQLLLDTVRAALDV